MGSLGDIMGSICKVAFPIPEESYLGNHNSTISICTLSSIDLLKNIAASDIMGRIYIAGRLFSENRGIDSLVKYVNSHRHIRTIILCGQEVSGHRAGHSLLQLYKNGTNQNGRIKDSISPEPFLTISDEEIAYFQNHITLINQIGLTDIAQIRRLI
ncbi:MAG: tetrahydromethanopterin S-methyltransferase subunit A [Thaumarchaeota archaeon]|nr:tetrahydromethanopterin S-methyltransferase subunit A [Nitrososphaerota archaeon]